MGGAIQELIAVQQPVARGQVQGSKAEIRKTDLIELVPATHRSSASPRQQDRDMENCELIELVPVTS
jgi:hypothetical protein